MAARCPSRALPEEAAWCGVSGDFVALRACGVKEEDMVLVEVFLEFL